MVPSRWHSDIHRLWHLAALCSDVHWLVKTCKCILAVPLGLSFLFLSFILFFCFVGEGLKPLLRASLNRGMQVQYWVDSVLEWQSIGSSVSLSTASGMQTMIHMTGEGGCAWTWSLNLLDLMHGFHIQMSFMSIPQSAVTYCQLAISIVACWSDSCP
jgi:hypothetical protein